MTDAQWRESVFGRSRWREDTKAPGRIIIADPAWIDENIVQITLEHPLPGAGPKSHTISTLRCHRLIADPLQQALADLKRRNKLATIRTWNGCFVARHENWDRHNPLSWHSWGVAFDVNANAMPRGSRLTQDPVLLGVMAWYGFENGTHWQTPDPMHFQPKRGHAAWSPS